MPDPEFKFHVFLSHNSKDKPAVTAIARILKNEYKLNPWLDRWQLVPGSDWQRDMGEAIDKCQTIAVFVGEAGMGAWEAPEVQKALNIRARDRSRRVIPVLLPGAPDNAKLELQQFLDLLTWVDLRDGHETKESLYRLYCGIIGEAPGDSEAVSSQTLGTGQPAEHFRQLRADTVQPESNKGLEISQQPGTNTPSRREGINPTPKPLTEEELRVSRKNWAALNQAQDELKDFVYGYIKFSALWVECDKAYSKLRDQLEDPTEDISSMRYWNDIRALLKHAQTEMSGDAPHFLRSKSSEFAKFNEALDEALRLVRTVEPKTAKEDKVDIIGEAHNHLENAVVLAETIVDFCQQGATAKLTEISLLIKAIFEAGLEPNQEAFTQAQSTNRPIDRPTSETLGLATSVALPSNQDSYR